jgi:putative holliday junction resolvase
MSMGPHAQSIVAFDYGTKRIGVAVGQTVSGTASPVATVRSRAGNPDWNAIRAIVESFAPEALVVGIPIEVNEGEDTIEHPLTRPVMRFADQLHGLFGLPVHIVDERLSTYEARSRAPGDGQIDAVAAQVILETWLHACALPGAPRAA